MLSRDLYNCFVLCNYHVIPGRLSSSAALDGILKNINIDHIFLALIVDIGRDSYSFKRAAEVFNAIDNSHPIEFVKVIKDNLDAVFAISRKLKTDLFLNWFKRRTEIKAKYSKSIASFYDDLCKKCDDFNKSTMFLH